MPHDLPTPSLTAVAWPAPGPYDMTLRTARLGAGDGQEFVVDTRGTGGWYDVTVSVDGEPYVRQFAGHLEDGRPSVSDPAFGR